MRTQSIELPYFPPMESHILWERIHRAFSKVNLNCARDVLLIIDDYTRPATVQSYILDTLIDIVGAERVSVVVASGLHRSCSYQEIINKLGNNVKKVRLYTHNPITGPSPFLDRGHFIIGINTVLPHLHTFFSNCGKLICPGLKSHNDAKIFHDMSRSRAQLSIVTKRALFDIGFDVYVNSNGDVIDFFEQDICENNPKKEYYTVGIPQPSNVAILRPLIKYIDFQQTMNVINILQYSPLVCDGGTVCIEGCTPEGIGIHYLYQQPNGISPIKYDKAFSYYFKNKRIAFIMPNLNYKAIKEYFDTEIYYYSDIENFLSDMEYLYGRDMTMNIFNGADIMMGKENE